MSQQYFADQPAAPHRPGSVHVILPDLHLELRTDAGMFSPGRLDPGTRLLLDVAPPPPGGGHLLDLGCGYGPVRPGARRPSPAATVWAVDVNQRALALTAVNAADAGLANVRAVSPDDQSLPAAFDLIWSQSADQDRQGGPASSCSVPGWHGSPTAPPPTWWCSAISAPTRCSAG